MNLKNLIIGLVLGITFVASCIAGYLTLTYNNKNIYGNNGVLSANAQDKQAQATKEVNINDQTVISSKMTIIKRVNYTEGIPTTIEYNESPGPEVLGMDRKAAEEYFKKQGFLLSDFNSKNVIVFKDINSWPPNYYVVKGEKGSLNIYSTNNEGKLQFLKKSQYSLDSLPKADREELQKGKSFPRLEDIDNMFDELDS